MQNKSGPTNPVTISSASPQVTGLDFLNYQQTTLSGTVFNDANRNGRQDPGEAGLPRRPGRRHRPRPGEPDQLLTTDANGFWQGYFDPRGDYNVKVVPPAGATATPLSPVLRAGTSTKASLSAGRWTLGTRSHLLADRVVGVVTLPGDPAGKSYVGFRGLAPVAASYDLSNPSTFQFLDPWGVAFGLLPSGGFENPESATVISHLTRTTRIGAFGVAGNTGSGVSGNDSDFTGSVLAPEGTQVAYLQGTGTISQTVRLRPGPTASPSWPPTPRQRPDLPGGGRWRRGGHLPAGGHGVSDPHNRQLHGRGGCHTSNSSASTPTAADNTVLIDVVSIESAAPTRSRTRALSAAVGSGDFHYWNSRISRRPRRTTHRVGRGRSPARRA